jgi:hypothetical protein
MVRSPDQTGGDPRPEQAIRPDFCVTTIPPSRFATKKAALPLKNAPLGPPGTQFVNAKKPSPRRQESINSFIV